MQMDILTTNHNNRAAFEFDTLLFASFGKAGLRLLPRLLCFLCLVLPLHKVQADETKLEPPVLSSVSTEIQAIIAAKQHPFLLPGNFTGRAEDLNALYQLASYQPLWLTESTKEQNLDAAFALLDSAAAHGLNQDNYSTKELRDKRQASLALSPDAHRDLASYDTAISLSVLRFLHDLHYGRVNPQGIAFDLKLRDKKLIDLPMLIKTHLDQHSVETLSEQVEPKLHQYQKLKAALAGYLKEGGKDIPFKLAFSKQIRPGDPLPQAQELVSVLTAMGDMPLDRANATMPEIAAANIEQMPLYTSELVDGIKKFQQRHGLAADGVIGKSTALALGVPLPKRAEQISLAMERLRWLPELSSDPSILVNIPAFQLMAYENINDPNSPVTNMRVVVGKALKNQTPVLMATMSYIEFSPYWNVPYNIVKDEILPKLSKSPGFLNSQNMELVAKSGGLANVSLAQLKQGTVRIRQKPGKGNALGKVKFLFPNKNDVYLHDTPSRSLFSRSRRDFSHGCVRVAQPDVLAEFALKNQKGWDKAAIRKAMNAPKMRQVILKKQIPVMFFYATAFFDENNNLTFYPDIYGLDNVLQEALKTSQDVPDEVLIARAPEPIPLPEEPALESPDKQPEPAAVLPQPVSSAPDEVVNTADVIRQ